MDRILLPLFIALIVPSVLSLLFAKAEREKKTLSIKRFTVSSPRVFRNFFLIASGIPVIIGLILYIAFASNPNSESREVLIFLCGLSGVILLLGLVLTLWKLDVDGDSLKYRNFFGLTKKISVDKINRVVTTDHKSIIIYANGRRFGSMTREFSHLENFKKYCARYGIEMQPDSSRPLTKRTLCMKAMRPMFIIGYITFGFFVVFSMGLYLGNSVLSIFEHVILGAGLGFFFFILLLIIASPIPLRGISLISKQEKLLGFRFDDEMSFHKIYSAEFSSDLWFVCIDRARVIALRRDYIRSVEKDPAICSAGAMTSKTSLVCADGNVREIIGSHNSITTLTQWLIGREQ